MTPPSPDAPCRFQRANLVVRAPSRLSPPIPQLNSSGVCSSFLPRMLFFGNPSQGQIPRKIFTVPPSGRQQSYFCFLLVGAPSQSQSYAAFSTPLLPASQHFDFLDFNPSRSTASTVRRVWGSPSPVSGGEGSNGPPVAPPSTFFFFSTGSLFTQF